MKNTVTGLFAALALAAFGAAADRSAGEFPARAGETKIFYDRR